jgi:hypothetical protein
MSMHLHSGAAPRRLVVAGVLLALLAGCSERDDLSAVVVRAGNEMTAAAGNGASMPPTEMRVQTYNSVLSTLREALRGHESEPGAAAAKLLIAQALLGQGGVAAEKAGDLRRDLIYGITELRSRLDLQVNRETLADAYANYNPSTDLSDLDASQQEVEKELGSLRATLADKQKRMETLQGQMDDQKREAEQRVAEASDVRAQATDASAIRRAELITRANEIERVADQHEKKYAELQLLVQRLEDESNEVRIRIASAQRREELVREARDRIEASAKLLASQSSGARTDAENIASELGSMFDTLLETLDQQETPAFEEAAGKYREASSQAMQARNEVATSAPAVAAMAQHASADLHLAQADLLENFHLLANDLSTKLQAPRFAEAASKLDERLKEARTSAADLFETAGSTYARLSVGSGDSLQPLSDRFRDYAGALRGEQPKQPEGQMSTPPADGSTATPPPDEQPDTGAPPADAESTGAGTGAESGADAGAGDAPPKAD